MAPPRQSAAAVAAFLAVALAFLPAGLLTRYLSFAAGHASRDLPLAALAAALGAGHAALVFGPLYRALGARLPIGFGAPLVAFLGALGPAAARLDLLPRPAGPALLVGAQAFLTEVALAFALALLALGTGGGVSPALAAALLWASRLLVHPVFFGGVVPVLELFSGIAAAAAVALVLRSALAPHRDALMEVP